MREEDQEDMDRAKKDKEEADAWMLSGPQQVQTSGGFGLER